MKAKIAAGLLALFSCGNVGITEGEKLNFDRRSADIHTWMISCIYQTTGPSGQEGLRYPAIRGAFTGTAELCEEVLKVTVWSHTPRYAYDVKASYTDCRCVQGSLSELRKELPCPYQMH